jgi:uncharacterized protein
VSSEAILAAAGPELSPEPGPARPAVRRPHAFSRVLAAVLALPVRAWRLVSRWLPPRCRFYPSCSAYALEALERHGAFRGSWLAARRLARCHPWNPGGLDYVPEPNARSPRRGHSHAAPHLKASS